VNRRRLAGLAAGAVLIPAAVSACTPDVTSARVQTVFSTTFDRLYRMQQAELGHHPPAPLLRLGANGRVIAQKPYSHTRCHKGAKGAAQTGAGDNWTCVEFFERPTGTIAEADYDVAVQTDGCLIATGPSQVVGGPQLQTQDGRTLVNPLTQFDACFPT